MEEQLLKQSLTLMQTMTMLRQILDEIKNANTDIGEDIINNLYQVIDKTADTVILFLTEIQKIMLNDKIDNENL